MALETVSTEAPPPPYLSLPEPVSPEPRVHRSVNALIDARARAEADRSDGARPAIGFTELDLETGGWRCRSLDYRQIRSLGVGLASELESRLPSSTPNGRSPNGTPLVAVLSPSGVELFAHILALWRLGYDVLCIARVGIEWRCLPLCLRTSRVAMELYMIRLLTLRLSYAPAGESPTFRAWIAGRGHRQPAAPHADEGGPGAPFAAGRR
ncbi:hypothetical protein ACQY0O_002035 [Thecaphora frezii]